MSIPPDSSHTASLTPPVRPPVQSATMIDRLKSSWANPSKRPMLIFGFGAMGIAVVLLLVAVIQLASGPAAPAPTPTLTPCVGPNCRSTPSPIVPKKLYARDRIFEITPVAVPNGVWKPTATNGNVEWVFGTLVNYLIGLPDTSENKDLLQARP